MGATLPNKGFTIPTVGSDFQIWGPELNNGWIVPIDGQEGGVVTLQSTLAAGGVLSLSASQAYSENFAITTNSTGNITAQFTPSAFPAGLTAWENNNQSGFTTTVSQSGGTQSLMIAAGGSNLLAANNTGAFLYAGDAHYRPAGLGVMIDGVGMPIGLGLVGQFEAPFAGTITAVTVLADVAANIQVDVWKTTFASFPPSSANSITGGNPPALSGGVQKSQNSLTGWTTTFNSGDLFTFDCTLASTGVTKLAIAFQVNRA
jgi:hypothetical protein